MDGHLHRHLQTPTPPVSPSAVSPRPSSPKPTLPLPKEFPIEKISFCAEANLMIKSGCATIAGKTAISNAVVVQMMKYCTSAGYAPTSLKRMSATALVTTYPTLKMGMGVSEAVKAWQECLTNKLSNSRKRGKISDPKMCLMKEKYAKHSNNNSNMLKKKSIGNSVTENSVAGEDLEEQEFLKESMKSEMAKPVRQRNVRLLDTGATKTFPLLNKFVLETDPHVKDLIREWPALKTESIMLNEFRLVTPEVADYSTFASRLDSILTPLVDDTRSRATGYPKSHPLSRIVSKLPWAENSDPDFSSDLNLIGAIAGLAYTLPTTTKKPAEAREGRENCHICLQSPSDYLYKYFKIIVCAISLLLCIECTIFWTRLWRFRVLANKLLGT